MVDKILQKMVFESINGDYPDPLTVWVLLPGGLVWGIVATRQYEIDRGAERSRESPGDFLNVLRRKAEAEGRRITPPDPNLTSFDMHTTLMFANGGYFAAGELTVNLRLVSAWGLVPPFPLTPAEAISILQAPRLSPASPPEDHAPG